VAKGSFRGVKPHSKVSSSLLLRRVKERRSLSYITNSPSPFKERGIKGVRLINNLIIRGDMSHDRC